MSPSMKINFKLFRYLYLILDHENQRLNSYHVTLIAKNMISLVTALALARGISMFKISVSALARCIKIFKVRVTALAGCI